jgi:hypothetical protein
METIVLILDVVLLLAGLVMIGLVINLFMKAKKAKKTWLTAPGVVLNSYIQIHQSRYSRGQTKTFEPRINFQFQVGDLTYTGDRLGFGSASSSAAKANKKMALYPQGAQVTVHYDPARPSKAVLETKVTVAAGLLFPGILCTLMGALGAIVVFPQ